MGLVDGAEEVVIPSLAILARLAQRSGVVVLSRIDTIVAQFEKLSRAILKLVSSKQSQERAIAIVRASLRVVHTIESSSELQEQPAPRFQDFLRNSVMANADAKALYEKIAAASQGAQMQM